MALPDDYGGGGGGGDPTDPTVELGEPYGQAAAVESVGTAAAPPLAGFSFALIVLVLQSPTSVACPEVAIGLLTGAGVMLITCTQAAFNHRRHYVHPDVWQGWLSIAPTDERKATLKSTYIQDLKKSRKWRIASTWSYNAGILLLFAGVLSALWPGAETSRWRFVAVSIVGFALIAEVVWVAVAVRNIGQRPDGSGK